MKRIDQIHRKEIINHIEAELHEMSIMERLKLFLSLNTRAGR